MKLLIVDSKTNILLNIDQKEYKAIIMEFAQAIAVTRLQKSARLVIPDNAREAKSKELSTKIKEEVRMVIQNQDFTSKVEAMDWLLAS